MPEPLRVVIAEDAAIMRDGLAHILTHRGHHVAAAVADAPALLAAVDAHRPDVAVIDVRMPPTHTDEGLHAALSIHRGHPRTGVLVFSQYIETRYAAELLTGTPEGVGYLLKDRVANVSEFLAAMTGSRPAAPPWTPRWSASSSAPAATPANSPALTPRERQVLALIAEGRSNAAIAETLVITHGVVTKHIASIFAKLGLPPSDSDNRRVLATLRYLQS